MPVEVRASGRKLSLVLAAALLTGLAATSPAVAKPDHKMVVTLDNCDPATFNAFGGPGTCVGTGRTTFADFRAQLEALNPPRRWTFSRGGFGLDAGGRIDVVSRGGEFHTFAEVAQFDGGCLPVPFLNLGIPPVAECQPEARPGTPLAFITTGVAAGGTFAGEHLTPGTHRFQCLIHPWMRWVAAVQDD